MKHNSQRSLVRTREATPKLAKVGKSVELTCPFCIPPHPLYPDKPAPCGTLIEVRAVQVVIPRHTAKAKRITCLKCGQTGTGDMVQCMNGYVHLEECKPEMKIMTEPPKYSRLADAVYALPGFVHKVLQGRGLYVKEVQEIDPAGAPTGKVLGHFFYKAS